MNLIPATSSLFEAIDRLNRLSGNAMTLFLIDSDGKMVATLTDGDVRRAILAGISTDSPALNAANKNFKAVSGDLSGDTVALLRQYRLNGINLVPRLDSDGRIIEIIDLQSSLNRLPLTAILMAGGKGERLRPLTLDCPKPLLKIDGKAIIDYNVEALAAVGINDITVAAGYLAEKIEDHFATPVAGVKVKCVRESRPLGTIGAAAMVERPLDGSTLIMNSDLITTISFEEMFMRHYESGADITIAVTPYQVAVPFAVLSLDGERVTGLEEKPAFSYYANAGIYIMKNKILDNIEPGQPVDATDLIARTIDAGGFVTYYPISGTWLDVGSPTDFRQASELMRHHRNMSSAQQSSR